MSVKYYKINGVWNTYSYWHYHYGYTTEPSNAVGFKSCAYATFGQDVDPGYYIEGSLPGFLNWSMWAANSEYAWYNTQMMAVQNHRYPSVAESMEMTDGTVTSPAAMYDDDGAIYYLIRDDMADGWLTEEEATERGWSIVDTSFQAKYGVFGIDYRSTDLLPFDETEFEIMQSTGVQQTYGEFVDDAALDWMMGQNQIMSVMIPIEIPNELIVLNDTSGDLVSQSEGKYFTVPWNNKIFEDVDNYIVVVPMPTVHITQAYFTSSGSAGATTPVYASSTTLTVYDASGQTFPYDASLTYKAISAKGTFLNDPTIVNAPSVVVDNMYPGESISHYLRFLSAVSSYGGYNIYLTEMRFATCAAPDTAVVKVYDAQNNEYNAFKYTADGTDYYYVLDGVQTDWTDNLESIDYYLGPTLTLYMASGNKYIDTNVTNNKGMSSGYPVYADSALTMLYYWDYTKRIERGGYHVVTGKWIAYSIQTQADMPATTGESIYIQSPVYENSIYFGKNNSGNSYYTTTVLTNYFRVYDDAITVWINSDHQDHSVTGTQTYVSEVDWDDTATYKVLYFLSVNGVTNPTGSNVATNRLHYVSFENSGGKVAVKLTLGGASITIAKIVFYAKKTV